MSVTLSRFVRVMSGGQVVTDKLLAVRDGMVVALLAQMRGQLKKLTDLGLACDAIDQEITRISDGRTVALGNAGNQAKSEALETVKLDARAALGRISVLVGTHLGTRLLFDNEVATSLQAIDAASTAVARLSDPVLQRQVGVPLADLQNRRRVAVNVADAADLEQAIAELEAVTVAARRLSLQAGQLELVLGRRAGELAKVDVALRRLDGANGRIADDPLKRIAGRTRQGLGVRRDALANANAANLGRQLADAPGLLLDIAGAEGTSEGFATFGETKNDRQLMLSAAWMYFNDGKKARVQPLIDGANDLRLAVNATLTTAETDPAGASADVERLHGNDYQAVKDLYQRQVLLPKLQPRLDQALLDDPNGPEKQMQDALGKPEFEARMLEVFNTAQALGSPEIGKLSIGEAVAIYTYTSNDYWKMNGVNLGYYTAGSPQEALEIKIKNDEATKALARLDPVPLVTRRGEKRWPPADALQYVEPNVFALKAFWSTGVGFSFPGEWQITINGKTGKDVATMSAFPKEAEVLFPPGTRFKVTRVDAADPNSMLVEVEEI